MLDAMRMTEFWRRMERQFGPAYAESYARDQVLPELGGRTVQEALEQGTEAKDVWRAVCQAVDVPAHER